MGLWGSIKSIAGTVGSGASSVIHAIDDPVVKPFRNAVTDAVKGSPLEAVVTSATKIDLTRGSTAAKQSIANFGRGGLNSAVSVGYDIGQSFVTGGKTYDYDQTLANLSAAPEKYLDAQKKAAQDYADSVSDKVKTTAQGYMQNFAPGTANSIASSGGVPQSGPRQLGSRANVKVGSMIARRPIVGGPKFLNARFPTANKSLSRPVSKYKQKSAGLGVKRASSSISTIVGTNGQGGPTGVPVVYQAPVPAAVTSQMGLLERILRFLGVIK